MVGRNRRQAYRSMLRFRLGFLMNRSSARLRPGSKEAGSAVAPRTSDVGAWGRVGRRRHWARCGDLSGTTKLLGAALMVVELGVEEAVDSGNAVGLGLLDILHAAKDILGRLLELIFVGAHFLLDPEIVTAGLFQLGQAGIVSEATVLELLARSLGMLLV